MFFDFFDILRENHRSLIANPLILDNGQYQMDFVDLEKKASDPRAKMIYLCNPHNPVGRVWTRQELQTLGDICARHGVLVVSDEMHGDLVFDGHRYIPFASLGSNCEENSITCLSPAKAFNIASCCSAFTVIPDDEKRKAFQIENSRCQNRIQGLAGKGEVPQIVFSEAIVRSMGGTKLEFRASSLWFDGYTEHRERLQNCVDDIF